jgi:soluble lytic murein transglycosylase-like protein
MKMLRRIGRAWIITAAICLAGLPAAAGAVEAQDAAVSGAPDADLAEFERRAAHIWGSGNAWTPGPKIWVQYEPDLGERSAVDFESGAVHVQILLPAGADPEHDSVRAHLRQGISNLILGEARDPLEMLQANRVNTQPAAQNRAIRVYAVARGDSLWQIARRFHMTTQELAALNGLAPGAILAVGRPLKVLVFSAHDLTLDETPPARAADPLLLDQIRMTDGRPVPPGMVRDFAREVMDGRPLRLEKVIGADGSERLAVGVVFNLVSDHVEVRARKFHPLALRYAEKQALDPALVMSIMHAESVFNPRARSRTPAYGLMQLVPQGGGSEAYRAIYGRKGKLTPPYLYDPKNNIELGTTYFNILKNRYMGEILDPTSRTYCAVAAYNAGPANVGRAFVAVKSITQATTVINRLAPQAVYDRLLAALPHKESRNYLRRVLDRVGLYRQWQ